MSIDLTKLLALELALEHIFKATPGEKLEYLGPGEKAPKDVQVRTTQRGARGYYPSEIATADSEVTESRSLEPTEERPIESVQAPEDTHVSTFVPPDDGIEIQFTFADGSGMSQKFPGLTDPEIVKRVFLGRQLDNPDFLEMKKNPNSFSFQDKDGKWHSYEDISSKDRFYTYNQVQELVVNQTTFDDLIQEQRPIAQANAQYLIGEGIKSFDGIGGEKVFKHNKAHIPRWQIDRLKGIHINWESMPVDMALDRNEKEAQKVSASVTASTGQMNVWNMHKRRPSPAQIESLQHTLVHELGHTIAAEHGNDIPVSLLLEMKSEFQKAVDSQQGFVSEYSKTNASEFFAECFKTYITNPVVLAASNPSMYDMMDRINKVESLDKAGRSLTEADFSMRNAYERYSLVHATKVNSYRNIFSDFNDGFPLEALQDVVSSVATIDTMPQALQQRFRDKRDKDVDRQKRLKQILTNQIKHAVGVGDTREELQDFITNSVEKLNESYEQLEPVSQEVRRKLGKVREVSPEIIQFLNRIIKEEVAINPDYDKIEPWISAYGRKRTDKSVQKQLVVKDIMTEDNIMDRIDEIIAATIINDPWEVGEPITRESIRAANKKSNQTDNLSKLLALETAIELLFKVNPGEELEYIDSESELPKDTPLVRTDRGAIGYYPSQIGKKSEVEGQGVSVARPELEPDSPREISGVTAPSPTQEDSSPDIEVFYPNRERIDTATDANNYFDEVSLYLNYYLEQAKGSSFSPFLGKDVDPNNLNMDNVTKAGFTDGSKEGIGEPSGNGINSRVNWTVTIDGQPFIYKLVEGENQAEILSYSLDRALGLNVVPYTKSHSIDLNKLKKSVETTQNIAEGLDDSKFPMSGMFALPELGKGDNAAGHFQEFCQNCIPRAQQTEAMAEMLATKEGREEFLKVMLLDFLTGNEDRHTGNYLVTEDRKLVAIDNGFAGHASSWRGHQKGKSVDLLEKDSNDDYIFIERVEGNMAFPYMMAKEMRDKVGVTGILDIADRGSLAKEVSNMFDKYINPSNKKVVNKALKMSMWQLKFGKNSEQDYNALKNSFVEHASWNLQSGIIGNATGFLDVPYADDAMKQTMQELLDTDPYGGSKQNPQQKVDQMLSEYGEEDTPLPAAPGQVRDSERAAALQRAMEEANLDFEDLSSEALELEALRDLDYLD